MLSKPKEPIQLSYSQVDSLIYTGNRERERERAGEGEGEREIERDRERERHVQNGRRERK